MKPLLLDLDVFLDVILDRPPGFDAGALWSVLETGDGRGLIPAHGLTTIFYLLEKARGATFARDGVERIISVFGVAAVDDTVIRRALALGWPDVEDAVCAAAANETNPGQSGAESGRRGLPPADDTLNEFRSRCLG